MLGLILSAVCSVYMHEQTELLLHDWLISFMSVKFLFPENLSRVQTETDI